MQSRAPTSPPPLCLWVQVLLLGACVQHAAAWTWESPGTWYQQYPECAGQSQSPIDLQVDNSISSSDSFLKLFIPRGALVPLRTEMTADSNGVTVDMTPRNITLTTSEMVPQWTLRNVQYHVPSEHTLNGVRFPAERHLVFVPSDASIKEHLVFAELYLPKENHVDAVLDDILIDPETTDTGFRSFFPTFNFQADSFMRYRGSLTAPPCTEGVHWHVSTTPHHATPQQLLRLIEVIGSQKKSYPEGSPGPSNVAGMHSM